LGRSLDGSRERRITRKSGANTRHRRSSGVATRKSEDAIQPGFGDSRCIEYDSNGRCPSQRCNLAVLTQSELGQHEGRCVLEACNFCWGRLGSSLDVIGALDEPGERCGVVAELAEHNVRS
jgi:hypothetical protein